MSEICSFHLFTNGVLPFCPFKPWQPNHYRICIRLFYQQMPLPESQYAHQQIPYIPDLLEVFPKG
jgi:hypothetical protein